MPAQAHVRLERVSKQYGSVVALDDVDLDIAKGELLSVIGPSGCGKTTLLRMLAGFVDPSAGRIVIDGQQVTGVPPERRSIGMVFQSYALFPHLTVGQNVGFGLVERGVPRARVRERVAELLALIRLPDVYDRFPAQLSGGQQQRVALARAVACEPRVLLMDEPLGALDLKLREAMQIEIRRIQKALGTTTLYVTHDQSEAMRISDRIAVMNGGRIEQCGCAADLYAAPRTRFVAEFIGKMNFVPGTVVQRSGDAVSVKTDVGLVHARSDATLAVGDAVVLGVRPEDVLIDPAERSDGTRVSAQVEENAYLGTFNEIRVRV
ncbi:MAG TPA: ABC transporter ATP-binding protein, partial [Casimicrobiaceae bacterium]|nr:ABC transporter ATP-binding protein [Casimicrobiaceae bacterium]